MGEDEIASFDRLVAGKAGFEQRRAGRFAVFELSTPPASGRGVFFRVLDHKLNVRSRAGRGNLSNVQTPRPRNNLRGIRACQAVPKARTNPSV